MTASQAPSYKKCLLRGNKSGCCYLHPSPDTSEALIPQRTPTPRTNPDICCRGNDNQPGPPPRPVPGNAMSKDQNVRARQSNPKPRQPGPKATQPDSVAEKPHAAPEEPIPDAAKPDKPTQAVAKVETPKLQMCMPTVPLTRPNVLNALKYADAYLSCRHQNFSIIAGGQVVRLFRGRKAIDAKRLTFFGAHLDAVRIKIITDAFTHAQEMTGVALAKEWMDPESSQKMAPRHQYLTNLAQKSTEPPIFKGKALQVLAVPLDYGFIGVTSRLETPAEKPEDFEIAIQYLRAICDFEKGKPPTINQLAQRCERYERPMLKQKVLRRINAGYCDKYKSDGIKF